MHTAIAAGTDTFKIFENKDFLITDVLASKEIKKDGTPTVKVFIKLICMGANGYGIEKNNKKMVNAAEYIVLTRNKLDVV